MCCGKICVFALIIQITNFTCSDVNCRGENCTEHIEVPMLDRVMAPITLEFDITKLTKHLQKLVKEEVRKHVNSAVKEKVKNIVEHHLKEAKHKLNANITDAMSELKDDLIVSVTQSSMELNLWNEDDEKKVKVALTSCSLLTLTYYTGEILAFHNVKIYFGISRILNFVDTGVFMCEYPGLYMVSATVWSNSYNAKFQIYRNSTMIKNGFVSKVNSQQTETNNNYHAGTSVIVIDLKPDDSISIQAETEIEMARGSCLTIIKIT